MRKFLFFILAFLSFSLFSCKDDDEEWNISGVEPLDITGWLCDGGYVSDCKIYCLEEGKPYGKPWWEYYPETKTIKDYDDIELLLLFEENGSVYASADKNVESTLKHLAIEYYKKRSAVIIESKKKYEENHSVGWTVYFSAYTDGEVTITCDKTLFGEKSGTNLMKYFKMDTGINILPVGIEDTKMYYNYGDMVPETMDILFPVGAWLLHEYYFSFIEKPTEKYEELTLSVTMPVTREHVKNFISAQYFGKEPDSLFTHRVFKSDCLIKFDWK